MTDWNIIDVEHCVSDSKYHQIKQVSWFNFCMQIIKNQMRFPHDSVWMNSSFCHWPQLACSWLNELPINDHLVLSYLKIWTWENISFSSTNQWSIGWWYFCYLLPKPTARNPKGCTGAHGGVVAEEIWCRLFEQMNNLTDNIPVLFTIKLVIIGAIYQDNCPCLVLKLWFIRAP